MGLHKQLAYAGQIQARIREIEAEFGLPKVETERLISAFDEDYQISRYMIVSREIDAMSTSFPADSRTYLINGYECSHISFEPGIKKLL